MNMSGITTILAEFCANVTLEELPGEVVERTPVLLLDLLGSVVRARGEAAVAPPLLATVEALGMGGGPARVFGDVRGYTPAGAAWLNGALGHALDFDDTHAAGTLHPGAPVIPAAIAAAEIMGASGADTLAGIVAGYETCCRIAVALPAMPAPVPSSTVAPMTWAKRRTSAISISGPPPSPTPAAPAPTRE